MVQRAWILVVLLLVPAWAGAQRVTGTGPEGEWLGRLDAGPATLRLVVRIEQTSAGALRATLNSVDQGATMPVDAMAFDDGMLRFRVEDIDGSYEGTMAADGSVIDGTWSQGVRAFPVRFSRLAEPFALDRPQTPQPPFPYDTRDVTVESATGISLACTLIVPRGGAPAPAVLFLSGSGAQDRDETIMGHQPFLVLADHLGRRAIASLRCDDRGVGGSTGNTYRATTDDAVADARAALRILAEQPGIDPLRVGLLGHSEGGLVAPRVATVSGRVAFLVLLAPPALPMDQILVRQTREALAAQGAAPQLIERALASQAEDLALVQDASLSAEALTGQLNDRAEAFGETLTPQERETLGLSPERNAQAARLVSTPWFRSLMQQDPADALRRIDIPVLALFGGRDRQVAADTNAPAMEAALAAAPTREASVRVLPELNHLFQHAESGLPAEYGTITETVAPGVLDAVAGWIAER